MAHDGDDVAQRVGREVGRKLVAFATDRHEGLGERPDALLGVTVGPGSPAEAPKAPYEPGQVGLSGGALVISGHGAVRLGTIRPLGSCRG